MVGYRLLIVVKAFFGQYGTYYGGVGSSNLWRQKCLLDWVDACGGYDRALVCFWWIDLQRSFGGSSVLSTGLSCSDAANLSSFFLVDLFVCFRNSCGGGDMDFIFFLCCCWFYDLGRDPFLSSLCRQYSRKHRWKGLELSFMTFGLDATCVADGVRVNFFNF
ncbi:hypothetical protein M9H77_27917 [Catharanthus roseus]|uniref:Uncharacterized protein n=1 Tax=Catharanthus roseus TaxID=4058 RepID=A0ACC0AE93_CATRO|nr:hypothetical protein M9H77_27917 [Catharanthus roseus]